MLNCESIQDVVATEKVVESLANGYKFSGIASEKPDRIVKRFRLDSEGVLVKEPGGQLVEGWYNPIEVSGPKRLAKVLADMEQNAALTLGQAGGKKSKIYAEAAAPDKDALLRKLGYFEFPAGPGLLFLDHDPDPRPGATQFGLDAFRQAIIGVCPEIADAPSLWGHSSGGHVYSAETGECLKGEGGHHGWIFVEDARDVPRALKVLADRLWLAGHGYLAISKGATVLERTMVDTAVGSPERLVFAGGAACGKGLEQRRPAPLICNDGAKPLDTRTALPDLTAKEKAEVARLKAAARQDKAFAEELAHRRQENAEGHTERLLAAQGMSVAANPDEAAKIQAAYLAASEHLDLYSPFELQLPDGTAVLVDEILRNPGAWHGKRCADPLEPTYANDRRIAYIGTHSARGPYIFSHAHGGRRFSLRPERLGHRLTPGDRLSAVEAGIEALRRAGTVYERDASLVQIAADGRVLQMNLQNVTLELDRHVRWLRKGKTADAGFVPCDCPRPVAEGVTAMRGRWDLPVLKSIATAPTLDPLTGRGIERDGYDEATGLLLIADDLEGWPGVPEHPTLDNVRRAVARLWLPFEKFPFVGPIDRGVFLGALLAAIVRAVLPTCPGIAIVASTAGSGKTLLAKCLAVLAGCLQPSIMAAVKDEDEMRKTLLAAGRRGSPALILDNINSTLGSDALGAWLTSEYLTQRILGVSDDTTVRTGGMVIATGNNLRVREDMCRRIFTTRIEPDMESPWRRAFDIDPEAYCREHRLEMVADALTILRYYLNQPNPVAKDRLASFEVWSDSVRRAVVGIGADELLSVADPCAVIEMNYADDPDRAKILALGTAWESVLGSKPVTVQDIADIAMGGVSSANGFSEDGESGEKIPAEALADFKAAVYSIAGEGHNVNTRKVGAWLAGKAGRIVAERRFVKDVLRRGYQTWRLEAA